MPKLDDENIPNELLYGRAGYLYALLYIKTNSDKTESHHAFKHENAILKVRFFFLFSIQNFYLTDNDCENGLNNESYAFMESFVNS